MVRREATTALVAAVVIGLAVSAGFVGVISANGSDGNYLPNDVSNIVFCADGIGEDGVTQQVTITSDIIKGDTVVGATYTSSVPLDAIYVKTGGQGGGTVLEFSNPSQSGSVDTSDGTPVGTSVNNPCGDKDDEERFNYVNGVFEFEEP